MYFYYISLLHCVFFCQTLRFLSVNIIQTPENREDDFLGKCVELIWFIFFIYIYSFTRQLFVKNCLTGPKGELRAFLDGLAEAKDVPTYVKDHPFGEPAITPSHSDWDYYEEIICGDHYNYSDSFRSRGLFLFLFLFFPSCLFFMFVRGLLPFDLCCINE